MHREPVSAQQGLKRAGSGAVRRPVEADGEEPQQPTGLPALYRAVSAPAAHCRIRDPTLAGWQRPFYIQK